VELLQTAVREIEGLTVMIPMLGIIFLIAYRRGLDVNRNGQLPEWVLTAMNAVAQTIMLQMVLAVLEAHMSRFLVTGTSWEKLHAPPQSPRGAYSDQQGPAHDGEPPTVAQLPRAGGATESAGKSFSREGQAKAASQDATGTRDPDLDDVMQRHPGQPAYVRQRRSELVAVDYEKKILGRKSSQPRLYLWATRLAGHSRD
jgi:hypothetical protein